MYNVIHDIFCFLKSLLLRLSALGLRRAIAPKRLVEPEDDEMDNDMEQTDPNVFLAQVAGNTVHAYTVNVV